MTRLTALALLLAACAAPAPAYTYDASGTWAVETRSRTEAAWRASGTMTITQGEDTRLSGTLDSADGTVHNTVEGNARTGDLTISGGGEVLRVTGTFTGNTYAGTYTYGSVDAGDVRMTR